MFDKFERVQKYLRDVVDGFVNDPADSDYQEGYLQAILELQAFITKEINNV